MATDYVAKAFDIMEKNPAIGMLGGNGKLTYETNAPYWVVNYPIHASGPQAPATVLATLTLHGVYGASSVMRKSAYERIRQAGFRFLLTDRLGSQLSSGGDFELCHGLAMAGYWIWYDERLVFTHFITANRITWSYYIHYLNQNALSFTVLEPYHIFLETKSHSLLEFWGVLSINLMRFLFSFFHTLVIESKLGFNDNNKANRLKLITLKPRIFFYERFVKMTQNFLIASAFQQQMARGAV